MRMERGSTPMSSMIEANDSYSCLLGRPTSVDMSCVDTLYALPLRPYAQTDSRPPSNIDIDSLRADPKSKPKPMDEPTYGTYLLLRQKLGVIVARVSRTHIALLIAGRT
jgi:hypothetical protein